MNVVSAAEMREIDRLTTEQFGVPSLTLMENAGTAVAKFAQKHFTFTTVCVVCGKGNNGGDGFVASRKLHEAGKQVSVIILAKSAEELRGDATEMFKKLPVTPLWVSEEAHFGRADLQQALRCDLIIDAILGTGFKPPIKGIAEKAVQLINASSSPVVAIDVPSGVDADNNQPPDPASNFVHADGVISFTALKPALAFANLATGPIAIAQIGSPEELVSRISSQHPSIVPGESTGGGEFVYLQR
jgi:ADP-dependent NAD(P)H-hydrate dehydratase / NAD(P)H-hydrate epimerase